RRPPPDRGGLAGNPDRSQTGRLDRRRRRDHVRRDHWPEGAPRRRRGGHPRCSRRGGRRRGSRPPHPPPRERGVISVGVIGYGYWGPNLARNFAELEGGELGGVSDVSEDRLALVKRRYPGCKTFTDYRRLLEDPSIDAVVVATPVPTHHPVTMAALAAGKHVLVTK